MKASLETRFPHSASIPDILCTRCGLCCDGTIFAEVELASKREALGLEAMGLNIDDDSEVGTAQLLQPCGALKGTKCSIYRFRPECCRTFECGLLQKVEKGALTVAEGQEKIAKALHEISQLKGLLMKFSPCEENLPLKERCLDALAQSEEFDGSAPAAQKRAELEAAMKKVDRTIRSTFLGR